MGVTSVEHTQWLVDRRVYDGQTWFSLVGDLWNRIEACECRRERQSALRSGSPGQRALIATAASEREICSGGFDQLFFSTTGSLAYEALLGLHRLQATAHAKLVEQAMLLFPGGQVPRDRFARQGLIELLPEGVFDRLDHEWFGLSDDLDWLRTGYITAHPGEFFVT